MVLSQCVHLDQTSFMNNRHLGDNIRKLLNVINFVKQGNNPAMCYFIDTEKVFDRVE